MNILSHPFQICDLFVAPCLMGISDSEFLAHGWTSEASTGGKCHFFPEMDWNHMGISTAVGVPYGVPNSWFWLGKMPPENSDDDWR